MRLSRAEKQCILNEMKDEKRKADFLFPEFSPRKLNLKEYLNFLTSVSKLSLKKPQVSQMIRYRRVIF